MDELFALIPSIMYEMATKLTLNLYVDKPRRENWSKMDRGQICGVRFM